ncbi:Protein CASP [Gracilariopsis chorda]|uniref:Protein CASP n=1 Tax=Gracilariopsis chorda TaxID=448386 RepID=A0A2V3IIT5_9FLOR|nr:Protein CASP [Gracilariopsis chorda]|eukprot:PXF42004.1 Protein CASP [Gracilariopsis chorda]
MSAIESSPDINSATAAPAPSQTPLEVWRTFDLNGRRAELDKQGLDIADRMEQSQASRKQLTSATRALRSSMADGSNVPKKDYISLLKSYQMEVDSLTTRAKLAETVFLSLYKDLYEVPDPVEELTRAAANSRRAAELERANEALEKERGTLTERNTVVNKYEKKIADLEAEIDATKTRASEETSAKIEEKQAEWMAAHQKTMEAYELREQELLHQLRISSDHTHRLETASDDLQRKLNDATSQLEAQKSSQASVSEMAVEDLERTRAEVKNLRTRCLDLENMLSQREKGMGDSDDTAITRSALSAELAARDVEVSQLHDQVSALEELLGGKDHEKSKEFAKLTSAIKEKDKKLAELNEQLSKFPTFEEYQTMVQQFETLQSFQLMEENETDDVTGATNETAGSRDAVKSSNTLERRLLEKVKTLEGKITRMRVDISEKDSEVSELRAQLRSNEEQIEDQKMLISKLEGSISAMTSENAGAFGSRRIAGISTDTGNLFNSGEDKQADQAKEDSAWEWGERQQAESLRSIIREEPSMLDIVAGQRDRFRARTMELEEDNRKLMERIEKLTSDLDSLKSDNVRLYENIRFLQSYQQSGGNLGKASNSVRSTDSHQAISIGDDEDSRSFLGKYRSMYEDMVNPYTIFNRRERHKRMSEMSAPERLTLRASQRALSTRTSRLIVFFYIILLHVLVALVLGFSPTSCDQNVTTKAQH